MAVHTGTGVMAMYAAFLLFIRRVEAGLSNSVSGLVSKLTVRSPFDQSELSKAKIPPTESPKIRPGYDS